MTLGVGTAAAAAPCAERSELVAGLASKYGEATVGIGLASNGNLLELLVSAEGASWTVIQTAPGGLACLVAAGESWQARAPGEESASSTDPAL